MTNAALAGFGFVTTLVIGLAMLRRNRFVPRAPTYAAVTASLAYPLDANVATATFINNPNNRSYQPRAYRNEYTIPEREDRRRVSEIVVRAHIQPVLPVDAPPGFVKTRVTLFVEGWDGGSRLIPVEPQGKPIIQEWRLTGMFLRLRAMRGLPLKLRFAVTPESDWLYGVNISNWPEGYDSKDARPVEVELRH